MAVSSHTQRRHSIWSEFWTLKAALLVVGLLHYVAWVATLVVCSTDRSSNSRSPLSLFFPLDIYAWSLGQTFYTHGILRSIADVLTRKAWESFEQRERMSSGDLFLENEKANSTTAAILPPLEIPTLNVQDFLAGRASSLSSAESALAARSFLQDTYGRNWKERPILLKGLWTIEELVDSSSSRELTPDGLLQTTELVLPYFSDATLVGALEPDAKAPVSSIVAAMLYENKPHKIGSQFIVQSRPELMDEVAPLEFLTELLGDHFTKNHLMGNPHRSGWRSWLPGTTTVPVFIANTSPIGAEEREMNENVETSLNECAIEDNSESNSSNDRDSNFCANPDSSKKQGKPFTGLHCEPIANVAVQLWGSRTWTLVDPEHSWKLKPSISKDGRSFYPSNISPETLATKISRYVATTTPGDAIWLPTWTYHKVDYVYNTKNSDSDNNQDAQSGFSEHNAALHKHQLSIGASLFHFRPIDYMRRNPLFAVLLIPSLIKELAGIKTQ